jgi:hypothetical protein
MSARHWTAGLLLVALVALCLVIHASRTDPAWIAGSWDDSDYDDVAILVTSMASILVVGSVVTEPESFRGRTFSPTASRAPPIHS